jgi:hypothetical protein
MSNKNKKSSSTDNLLNKKGIRLWFWLMIVAPALFLLYFFLFNNSPPNRQSEKYALPPAPAAIGNAITINNSNYTVGPGKKIHITGELQLGNNTVAAEAGQNFIVVPLQLPRKAPGPAPENWWLQDGEGNRYPLLKVTSANPAAKSAKNNSGDTREDFLIFKAPKETTTYYVVYMRDNNNAAWKIK